MFISVTALSFSAKQTGNQFCRLDTTLYILAIPLIAVEPSLSTGSQVGSRDLALLSPQRFAFWIQICFNSLQAH